MFSQQQKVFLGTVTILGISAITFFGPPRKKSGHNTFDVDRPEEVQKSIDQAQNDRLQRLSTKNNDSNK